MFVLPMSMCHIVFFVFVFVFLFVVVIVYVSDLCATFFDPIQLIFFVSLGVCEIISTFFHLKNICWVTARKKSWEHPEILFAVKL